MKAIVNEKSYCTALEASLKYIASERANGKKDSFEKLFYPLIIGDGAIAFQSYSEQIKAARDEEKADAESFGGQAGNRAIAMTVLQNLGKAFEKHSTEGAADERPDIQKQSARPQDALIKDENDALAQQIIKTLRYSQKSESLHKDKTTGAAEGSDQKEVDNSQLKHNQDESSFSELSEELDGTSEESIERVKALNKGLLEMINQRIQTSQKERSEAEEKKKHAEQDFGGFLQGDVSDIKSDNDYEQLESMEDFDEEYGLYPNSKYESASSLIIGTKRVMAIANAGHGKTTLLKRIALYYCYALCPSIQVNTMDVNEHLEIHREIGRIYGLERGEFIPCLISLRNYAAGLCPVEEMICRSIQNVFLQEADSSDILSFIQQERDRFLLLIDGLDELTSDQCVRFLMLLEQYLNQYEKTNVIITSRVAGIIPAQIRFMLRKMEFVGRTIIPLTDEQAKNYAQKWIDVTQQNDRIRKNLKRRLDQILSQRKYDYLKEFMRTPLELLIILRQLAGDSLSLDRYQLFHDMLFRLFTAHERIDRKEIVFEDTMSILGAIAFRMQMSNTLYLSREDLQDFLDQLNFLSYHTDLIKEGRLRDYEAFLNDIATNVGIIETVHQNGETVYIFPIRSYQEFLTAHACCHLNLDRDKVRPEPFQVLSPHLQEEEWVRIIHFALVDLYKNSSSEFDALIDQIFRTERNTQRLCSYLEADLEISPNQAMKLCEKRFATPVLLNEQKELILAWTNTKSAYAFHYALKNLYFKVGRQREYLEAYAFSTILESFESNGESAETVFQQLMEEDEKKAMLGAAAISVCVRLYFGELAEGYQKKAKEVLSVDVKSLARLYYNARQYKDHVSVRALTDLWLLDFEYSPNIAKLLDEDLMQIIYSELDKKGMEAKSLCVDPERKSYPVYHEIRELIQILGSFPVQTQRKSKRENPYLFLILRSLYEDSKKNLTMDMIAFAVAEYHYKWNYEAFLETWTRDICKKLSIEDHYRFVRRNNCSERENHHFALLKQDEKLYEDARDYINRHTEDINELHYNSNEGKGLFTYFREGDYLSAAKLCLRKMEKKDIAMIYRTNLAFLIRYAKLNDKEIIPYTFDDIPSLLQDGIGQLDKFALMNMALYHIERKEFKKAGNFIAMLTEENWNGITETFWKKELWDASGDPEGALVCVLAHCCQGIDYDDDEFSKMYEVASQSYPLADILKACKCDGKA